MTTSSTPPWDFIDVLENESHLLKNDNESYNVDPFKLEEEEMEVKEEIQFPQEAAPKNLSTAFGEENCMVKNESVIDMNSQQPSALLLGLALEKVPCTFEVKNEDKEIFSNAKQESHFLKNDNEAYNIDPFKLEEEEMEVKEEILFPHEATPKNSQPNNLSTAFDDLCSSNESRRSNSNKSHCSISNKCHRISSQCRAKDKVFTISYDISNSNVIVTIERITYDVNSLKTKLIKMTKEKVDNTHVFNGRYGLCLLCLKVRTLHQHWRKKHNVREIERVNLFSAITRMAKAEINHETKMRRGKLCFLCCKLIFKLDQHFKQHKANGYEGQYEDYKVRCLQIGSFTKFEQLKLEENKKIVTCELPKGLLEVSNLRFNQLIAQDKAPKYVKQEKQEFLHVWLYVLKHQKNFFGPDQKPNKEEGIKLYETLMNYVKECLKEKRAISTIRHYVGSFKYRLGTYFQMKFGADLNFVINQVSGISSFLKKWETASKKDPIEQKLNQSINNKDIANFLSSKFYEENISTLLNLSKLQQTELGHRYVTLLSTVVFLLTFSNFKRPECIVNMTLAQFKSGEWNERAKLYSMQVEDHITKSTFGAESMHMHKSTKLLLENYITYLRPEFDKNTIKEIFVNTYGNKYSTESMLMNLQRYWFEAVGGYKLFNFNLVRHGVVTYVHFNCEQMIPYLAQQITHTCETARRFYKDAMRTKTSQEAYLSLMEHVYGNPDYFTCCITKNCNPYNTNNKLIEFEHSEEIDCEAVTSSSSKPSKDNSPPTCGTPNNCRKVSKNKDSNERTLSTSSPSCRRKDSCHSKDVPISGDEVSILDTQKDPFMPRKLVMEVDDYEISSCQVPGSSSSSEKRKSSSSGRRFFTEEEREFLKVLLVPYTNDLTLNLSTSKIERYVPGHFVKAVWQRVLKGSFEYQWKNSDTKKKLSKKLFTSASHLVKSMVKSNNRDLGSVIVVMQ